VVEGLVGGGGGHGSCLVLPVGILYTKRRDIAMLLVEHEPVVP
jgi:hypothetical protein